VISINSIADYQNNSDFMKNFDPEQWVIFAFEGAGDGYSPIAKSNYDEPHKTNGRYDAMMVLVKDKTIKGIYTKTSTFPDHPATTGMAEIDDGTYRLFAGMKTNSRGNYPSMYIQNLTNSNVAGTRYDSGTKSRKEANDIAGIYIHIGWNGNAHDSTGCQLVVHNNTANSEDFTYYLSFGNTIGLFKGYSKIFGTGDNYYASGTRLGLYVKKTVTPSTPSNPQQDSSPTIQKMLTNIQNSSHIDSSKKVACGTAAKILLDNEFDPAFVAGVLGNICYEGNTGIFEYYNSSQPYQVYMQEHYNYRSEYSGKFIYNLTSADKNVITIYNLLTALSNGGWKGGFGLGSCQWTFDRTYTLVQVYKKINGGSSSITYAQTVQAEAEMVAYELNNKYNSVYTNWKSGNRTAYNAGSDICLYYEKPVDKYTKALDRGNLATRIYADMMN